ncbi:hypothetical protein BG000_000551, partial [Podila horticola]
MDETVLGNGIASKTETIQSFQCKSNLPDYEVREKQSRALIDVSNLATQYQDEEDYRDILLTHPDKATLDEVPRAPSDFLEFQVFDTPGLNGTQGKDSEHTASIVKQVISFRTFNLIVSVFSSKNPVTEEELIRKTIRQLLILAAGLPTVLDTREGNTKRIRSIKHSSQDQQKHSILVFGKTQSGKSRLIQHFLNYADPNHAIDKSLLGNGNVSKTDTSKSFFVKSDLPAYEVFRQDNGEVMDLDEGHRLAIGPSRTKYSSEFFKFQVLDTPGLNDSKSRDISHSTNIISEMIKTQSFSLIIIIVSYSSPVTMEQQLALDYYAEVLQGMHSRILFLHTHVDYTEIHHSNDDHKAKLMGRNNDLINLFRRHATDSSPKEKDYRSLTIDLVSKKRPIINCLIRNTYKKVKARYQAESVATQNQKPPAIIHGEVNILLMGDVQSGKSSLIEAVRRYTDPTHVSNVEHITQDNSRIVDEKVKITQFLSDLHTIQIHKLPRNRDELDVIDLDTEAMESSEEDFKSFLKLGPEEATFSISSHGSKKYRFNAYELPSLNVSDKGFERNINIFNSHRFLFESRIKFHQVLFTLAPGTKTDTSENAIQRAKTYLVVRDILFDAAANHEPVSLKSPFIRKTPKVVSIDSVLKSEYRDTLKNINNEMSTSGIELSRLRRKIRKLGEEYNKADKSANSSRNNEDVASCNKMDLVFEEKYTAIADPSLEIGWRNMTCRRLPRTIDMVHMVYENIEIEKKTQGGEGSNKWKIFYRHTSSEPATLEVKLYSKKLDPDGRPVGETSDMAALRHTRADLELRRIVVELWFKNLLKKKEQHCLLRFCIFRETLPQAVTEELAKPMAIKEIYLASESKFGKDPYDAGAKAVSSVEVGSGFLEQYSVLMFGKTQAGKSTFIEFVKNYADQKYKIDESLIGTGVKTTTGRPHASPSDRLSRLISTGSTKKPKPVDISNLANESKDADDYLDALNDRKVTVKQVDQAAGPNTPPPRQVEITFLDTPGIEDTNGRDTEHAPKVIHEMAKMRTLNLIIIVNCKDQPSISHQLGFGYYSKIIQILQGCHSNIVFVYTHVDYAQCHHTNVDYNKNMDLRHKAFRLFRGRSRKNRKPGAAGQDSFSRTNIQNEDVELYPMFKIDLNKKHRPIPSCMLLRTMQEILQMAVQKKPVEVKSIMTNLLKVYGISHPDELNQMQRERLPTPVRKILGEKPEGGNVVIREPGKEKDGEVKSASDNADRSDTLDNDREDYEDFYYDDCSFFDSQSSDDEGPQESPKYSVLILGSTQAGKSTLIQHIKSYADSRYAIDDSIFGNGIVSKTESTTSFSVESTLPVYEVYLKDTGEVLDLKTLASHYKDEEGYRDALLSHSDDVGMRLAPQDPTTPSGSMEFRFLDTPGLNGTQGRDSEHAVNIVNEVISTQTFNLIVFVISSKNPLTEEKRLALEYFAYVLRGLHSRIIFLYTHVDYADTHYTNTTHHLDMSMRNKTLSTIFRRHDGESMFDEFDITEYPSLTIDLTTRNRPIVQCMIRNTVREILTLATAPPAVLDTSSGNIERIRTAIYPTEFGQEQRKNLEARLRRNLAKPKLSVLIMGKTQAGKSTLIEHIKTYANPSYAIDQSLLGNGNVSKTASTQPFYVESNLPKYEVYRKDTGEVIDLNDFANRYEEEEDYRDILYSREKDVGLRHAPQDSNEPSELVEFRFLDTPGLNDTNDRDSSHAANIISEMINTRSFNLI